MAVLYLNPGGDAETWRRELARNLPGMDVRVWPDEVGEPADILYAVVWKPPPGELRRFTNLKGIMSLGAGVDHILVDPDLPAGVPIARLVDTALTVDMTHYVVHWVIHFHRVCTTTRACRRGPPGTSWRTRRWGTGGSGSWASVSSAARRHGPWPPWGSGWRGGAGRRGPWTASGASTARRA